MFYRLFLMLSVLLATMVLYAADVTDVVDAADDDDPFDFTLDISYNSSHHFGTIKREYNNYEDNAYEDVNGNRYYTVDQRRVQTNEYKGNPLLQYTQILDINAEIGLYHDLSLSVDIPIVLSDRYSLLFDNYYFNGAGNATAYPGSLPASGLFPADGALSYKHKGVGDLTIGMNWAPFSQERGVWPFSWLVAFHVTFPTSAKATPSGMNDRDSNGNMNPTGMTGKVGTKNYTLHFITAMSKRVEMFEPYFRLHFDLPIAGSNSLYQNMRKEYGFDFGTEFVFWERPKKEQEIRMRLDFNLLFSTRGNSYNYITDARWVYPAGTGTFLDGSPRDLKHILPMEDAWAQAGIMLKFDFHVWKYLEFGTHIQFNYRSNRYLTDAKVGEAGYINGLDSEKTNWLSDTKSGGRLFMENNMILNWGVNLALLF